MSDIAASEDALQTLIKQIRLEIAKKLIEELDGKRIDEDQSQEIAEFSLDSTEHVETEEQVTGFLDQLAAKWAIFANYCTLMKDKLRSVQATNVELSQVRAALTGVTTGQQG